MPDIDYWLGLKYSILQQQANADQARSGAAVTSANAAAGLDNVRTKLLPKQTAAEIAQTQAQTRLTTTQADLLPSETRARIGLLGSEASLNRANVGFVGANTASVRSALQPLSISPNDYQGILEPDRYKSIFGSEIAPPRLRR